MRPDLIKFMKAVAATAYKHNEFCLGDVVLVMPHDLFRAVTMIAGIEIVRAEVSRPYFAYPLEIPVD